MKVLIAYQLVLQGSNEESSEWENIEAIGDHLKSAPYDFSSSISSNEASSIKTTVSEHVSYLGFTDMHTDIVVRKYVCTKQETP